MAKVSEETNPAPLKPKTTATTFLRCFRFSKTKTHRSQDNSSNKMSGNKKSRSWLCWKKAAATKTVPLDVSTERQLAEPKSKHVNFDPKIEVPAVTDVVEDPGVPIQRLIIVSDKTLDESKQKPPEETMDRTPVGWNCSKEKRRLSFRRKVDSIRTGNSQPGSPVGQQAVISPSATAALPRRTRRGGGESQAMPSSARKPWLVSNEKTMTTKRLDPLVGMTIIMVTLVIMVLWGRLCAILCTAAWFYLLPRLTHTTSHFLTSSTAGNTFPHPRDDYLDFSSDEYKKKVVLEGFLDRNNHRTSSHLSHVL